MTAYKVLSLLPFSDISKSIVKEQGLTIEDLAYDPLLRDARELAKYKLMAAISGRVHSPRDENPLLAIYSYIIAKLIASYLGRFVLNRLAEHEAKRFMIISEGLTLEELEEVARKGFSIQLRIDKNRALIAIPEYLEASSRIGGSRWRMINRNVSEGYVTLLPDEVRRVLSELVRVRVTSHTPKVESLPDPLKEIAEQVSLILKDRVARKAKKGRIVDFPPCINQIMEKLRRGENVPHQARFALTTFLLRAGWTEDQIIDLFRNSPDFNEKIASYQVHHIASRGYSPPKCETMKGWGLCPGDCGRSYLTEGLRYGKKVVNR